MEKREQYESLLDSKIIFLLLEKLLNKTFICIFFINLKRKNFKMISFSFIRRFKLIQYEKVVYHYVYLSTFRVNESLGSSDPLLFPPYELLCLR